MPVLGNRSGSVGVCDSFLRNTFHRDRPVSKSIFPEGGVTQFHDTTINPHDTLSSEEGTQRRA